MCGTVFPLGSPVWTGPRSRSRTWTLTWTLTRTLTKTLTWTLTRRAVMDVFLHLQLGLNP